MTTKIVSSDHGLLNPTITELPGVTLPGCEVGLEEQKAAGQYNLMSPDITAKYFPLTLPAGPRGLVLAHFDMDIESEVVAAWAAAHDYELALIDDLLAVGSHSEYRELLQMKFKVVALGSCVHGAVPFLGSGSAPHRRYLLLGDWSEGWGAEAKFLLRKVPKQIS